MKNHGQRSALLLSKIRFESYIRNHSIRTAGSGKKLRTAAFLLIAVLLSLGSAPGSPQDMIRSGTGVGQEKTRVAVPNFRVTSDSAEVMKAFDDTLWNDLDNSGIIELVSKSFYPQQQPATPAEVFRTEMQKPERGRRQTRTWWLWATAT